MSLFSDAAILTIEKQMDDYSGPTIPLSFMKMGEQGTIQRISGRDDVKKYLAGLGFIPGTEIGIVNVVKGNVIVDVKGSRVALDAAMAGKIQCHLVS